MATRRLDITGPVSPYCLLSVERKAKALLPSDTLIITCDTLPAATTQIPQIARSAGLCTDSHLLSAGLWEITLYRGAREGHDPGPDP
jgi:TusA-related sulfurtransferase